MSDIHFDLEEFLKDHIDDDASRMWVATIMSDPKSVTTDEYDALDADQKAFLMNKVSNLEGVVEEAYIKFQEEMAEKLAKEMEKKTKSVKPPNSPPPKTASYTPKKSSASTASTVVTSVKGPPSTVLFSAKSKSTSASSTTWDMKTLMSEMTAYDEFDLDLGDLEYEGFDPFKMTEILAGHAEKAGKTSNEFKNDMKELVGIVVMRGTNKTNILDKTSEAGKLRAKALFDRYHIEEGSKDKKKSVPKDKVILSRVVGCFPVYAAMALKKGIVTPQITEVGLPIYLHFTGAPALIPSDDKSTYEKWLKWAVEFDKLINTEPDAKLVDFYGKIAHKSRLMNDAERKALMNHFTK